MSIPKALPLHEREIAYAQNDDGNTQTFVALRRTSDDELCWFRVVDVEHAAAPRSHVAIRFALHDKLLKRAELLVENGQHGEACMLIETAMKLRPQ